LKEDKKKTTYAGSGVNINEADKAVQLFAPYVASTYEGITGITVTKFGQFTGLIQFEDIPGIAFGYSMDGIGTKLEIALRSGVFNTVGECLLAHCINDMLTAGVKSRVLLDYVATAALRAEVAADIVISVAQACKKFGIVLPGGELAEMPDIYYEGEYDLVACIQGTVKPDDIIDGSKVVPGDLIFGFPSSGLHCNGYSMIRRVFADVRLDEYFGPLGCTYGKEFLKPSRCYAEPVHAAFSKGCEIHGMANITGGGIPGNLVRVLPQGCKAVLQQSAIEKRIPEIMRMTQQRGNVEWPEMVKTFNMGIGYIAVLPESSADTLIEASNYKAFHIGQIEKGDKPEIDFQASWGSF